MDVKGIKWAANMYRKFETLCLEVEEIIYQDTVKYMENQAQTVGATVKKFYAEVMEDLIPPSSLDRKKVTNSEFILEQVSGVEVCKKPKPMAQKEPLKVDTAQLRKRVKTSHQEIPSITSLASSESAQDDLSGESVDETEAKSEAISDILARLPSNASLLDSELAEHSAAEKNLSSSEGIPAVSQAEDISRDDEAVSFGASSMIEDFFSNVHEEFKYSDSEPGIIDHSAKSKLEESCIFVNGDELQFVAAASCKSRLDKDKVLAALSLRKKILRAQEYKQLAAQFDENPRCIDDSAPSSEVVISSMKSPASPVTLDQLVESEWELL